MEDARYIAVSLEGLQNLLQFGKIHYTIDGKNMILEKLESMGIFDVLENLQYHPVELVYDKTCKLLENFFDTENKY